MKPLKDMDYVSFHAKRLKNDNTLFEEQRMFLESQLASGRELARRRFGTGRNFKRNARIYLKNIGLI